MSNSPDNGLDLEELELQLLPAWAKQSPDTNRYAKYEGSAADSGPPGREHRERRGRRVERSAHRQRDETDQDRPRKPREGRAGPPRHEGGRFDRPRSEEKREPIQPLPEVSVSFLPEERGVESLARQIKLTGRAYPIFDIAHLILKRPDRYHVAFRVAKKADDPVAQSLWICNLDDTLWLSDQDAANHVLRKHFDTFYKAERTPADPPKGTYTFVAQCALSGIILGPPNYHDYQNKLRKLHAERFSRMPFEVYKSKVKIVKDEAVVKKWIEEQSWKTEFVCLNVSEGKRLGSREEVEQHFREVHFGNIIRGVESHTLLGAVAQLLPTAALRHLVRRAWDEQQRFPLKVVTTLSQQFAAHGLQFFKVNKTITHVAVARPHYLDLQTTPVSDDIKRIVDYINAHPGCARRQLIGALAPSPAPAAAPATPPPAERAVASPPTTEQIAGAPSAAAPKATGDLHDPTPEQTVVIADLHWLIHQGHVLEFANGRIETAKKPTPKPPRPEAKPAAPQTEGTAVLEAGSSVQAAPQAQTEPDIVPPGAEITQPTARAGSATNPAVLEATTAVVTQATEPAVETISATTQVAGA